MPPDPVLSHARSKHHNRVLYFFERRNWKARAPVPGQTQTSTRPGAKSALPLSPNIVSLARQTSDIRGDMVLDHSLIRRCVLIPTPRLKQCLIVTFRTDRSIPLYFDRLPVQCSVRLGADEWLLRMFRATSMSS